MTKGGTGKGEKGWGNKCAMIKTRNVGGDKVGMLLLQIWAGERKVGVENQALCFFFLQVSIVKVFYVIIHTQAVSLTKALFKSAVHNAPLMDSGNISICINGLLLMPTKPSMEPCTRQCCPIDECIFSSQNFAVNICWVECGRGRRFWVSVLREYNFNSSLFDYQCCILPESLQHVSNNKCSSSVRMEKSFTLTSEHTEPGGGRDLPCGVRGVAFVNSFISRGPQWLDPQDWTGPIIELDHLDGETRQMVTRGTGTVWTACGKHKMVYMTRSCSTSTCEIESHFRGKFKVFFLMSFGWPVEPWFIVAWWRNTAWLVTKITVYLCLHVYWPHNNAILEELNRGTGAVGVQMAGAGDLECGWVSRQNEPSSSASEGITVQEKRLKPAVMEGAKKRTGGRVKILDRL